MTINHRTLAKYLSQHAEAETFQVANLRNAVDREYALVIPAFKERFDFVSSLAAHRDADQVLVIVVLNEPQGQTQNTENLAFIDRLNKTASLVNSTRNCSLYRVGPLLCLLILRLGENAIPDKQGVGLARKIGADAATLLIQDGCIQAPWIFCSDADATIPDDYFEAVNAADEQTSGIVFNFTHTSNDLTQDHSTLNQATEIYERQIKYYREQLARAGSPYAFYTLGSCITCSVVHYAQVRGFPKKAGAEDFYLLNKLAKVGNIEFAENYIVKLASRFSDRVPFGTGPAVQQISAQIEAQDSINYYNPAIFDQLKLVLEAAEGFWQDETTTLEGMDVCVKEALQEAGFLEFVTKRRLQDKNIKQFRRSFNEWFDAFQTLKFVRRLERSGLSPTPMPIPNKEIKPS